MFKTLTIAVPAFNDAEATRKTLANLAKFSSQDGLEILISDNASEDDTARVISELTPHLGECFRSYRQSENLGFRGNLTFLAGEAAGKYIWFFGIGETIILENLEPLIAYLASTSASAGVVSGVLGRNEVSLASGQLFELTESRYSEVPTYSETISLNLIETAKCRAALGSDEGLTGSYWPHLEAILSVLASDESSFNFSVATPMVQIAENHDGWWFDRPNAYEILLSQAELLAAQGPEMMARFPWLMSRLHGIRNFQIAELIVRMRVSGNRLVPIELKGVLRRSGCSITGKLLIIMAWKMPWLMLSAIRAVAQWIRKITPNG